MRAINHIEFLCVYYHGGVCQQDNGGGIYVAQLRKLSRRRCVCGTRRKAKKATRIDGMSGVNKLDFSFFFRRWGWAENNERCTFKRISQKVYTQCQILKLFALLGVYINVYYGLGHVQSFCYGAKIIPACVVPPLESTLATRTSSASSQLLRTNFVLTRMATLNFSCNLSCKSPLAQITKQILWFGGIFPSCKQTCN
jgi:hypothetical protein